MRNLWSRMKGYLRWSAIKSYAFRHKVISVIIILVILFVGYKVYVYFTSTSGQTRYVIAAVQTGTIVQTVTGSGQVSASNQIDITPKASGDITYVGVTTGQAVKAGDLIAQIDSRSAAIDLENAQVALAKLMEPADKVSLIQAENAVQNAVDSKSTAQNNLSKAYDDGLSGVANSFIDLQTIMTGLDNLFSGTNGSSYFNQDRMVGDTARGYREVASNSYWAAKRAYDQNIIDYQGIHRSSASSSIESIITETYRTMQLASQAVKDTNNAVSFIYDNTLSSSRLGSITTDMSNLSSWTSKANSDLQTLSSANSTIKSSHDTLANGDRTIAETQASLTKLKDGPDQLDIRAEQLAVQQKELAYANYFIRAPFDGVIAKVDVQTSDMVGGSSVVATLITNKKIANVSLNEVDAAKVKVGQKATLTFDAVPDLSIAGEVSAVDLVGTVSQGVVNYNIQIAFDTQDARVRSGMSVDAAIATAVKQNVLIAPASAVKTQGNAGYVQMFDQSLPVTDSQGVALTAVPKSQMVQTGISDDVNTEIVLGLKAGDKIITRTITSSAAKTTNSAPSLFGAGGRVGGGTTGRTTSGRGG